jgi:hypothetical protein
VLKRLEKPLQTPGMSANVITVGIFIAYSCQGAVGQKQLISEIVWDGCCGYWVCKFVRNALLIVVHAARLHD